jgi:hypothetical protein
MKAFKSAILLTGSILLGAGPALAHQGHGNPLPHTHADAALWFVIAVIAAFGVFKLGELIVSDKRSEP